HRLANLAILLLADFGTQLHRPGAAVGHFEETNCYPHGEDVAARGDVIEKFAKQLILQVRMSDGVASGGCRLKEPLSVPGATDGGRAQQAAVYSSVIVIWSRRKRI